MLPPIPFDLTGEQPERFGIAVTPELDAALRRALKSVHDKLSLRIGSGKHPHDGPQCEPKSNIVHPSIISTPSTGARS